MFQITGDCKDRRQLKVIEIEKEEALDFIEQECNGRIQSIFDHLRYDSQEAVLYLVGNEVSLEEIIAGKKEDP